MEGAWAALKVFGEIAKFNEVGGGIKKPGSVFAEADATGARSPSLGVWAPVLAVQHLLHTVWQWCHRPCSSRVPAGAGSLNRYKTALKEPQEVRIQSKNGLEPKQPLCAPRLAQARVRSCPPPALPAFLQVKDMFGISLGCQLQIARAWPLFQSFGSPFVTQFSHWSNGSSA